MEIDRLTAWPLVFISAGVDYHVHKGTTCLIIPLRRYISLDTAKNKGKLCYPDQSAPKVTKNVLLFDLHKLDQLVWMDWM